MKPVEFLLATLIISTLLAACSSTPVGSEATPSGNAPSTNTGSPAPSGATARPAPASTVTPVVLAPHKDPNNVIGRERSVYFDYDDYSVKSQYNGLVERHGEYLRSHRELTIRLEGNADERGSAEYNLALGQKRAESVLRALTIYDVRGLQMEAVSYGEERPRATAHDDSAWAANRRVDIVYPN